MKPSVLTLSGIAAAIVATALALPGTASAQSAPSLHGTWRVQVTQYNCADPTVTFPPFWSILSFHRGGTATEATSNPALQPGQRTAGNGYWGLKEDGTYLSVTEAFILFDSPTNPPGLKKGVQKILQTISVTDENHFNAVATIKFFNADGTVRVGCATAQGTRLTASTSEP